MNWQPPTTTNENGSTGQNQLQIVGRSDPRAKCEQLCALNTEVVRDQAHRTKKVSAVHSNVSNNFTMSKTFERANNTLINFWYNDLPPLHGPLRIFFYGCLLLAVIYARDWWIFKDAAATTFSFDTCQFYASNLIHYKELGFEPTVDSGFFGKFLTTLDNPARVFHCKFLAWSVRWGLFFSCIGLGGRSPRVVAAAAWLIMLTLRKATWGKTVGCGCNLATVALLSLCTADDNFVDTWSADAQLCRIYRLATGRPMITKRSTTTTSGPSIGGAARKLVLFQATCIMYFSGLHKFSTWGFTWMDGATIEQSIRMMTGRYPLLIDFVLKHPQLSAIMATVSILGELGSVATLISPRWRPYGVASFVAFHLGIFLLMYPNFIIQSFTYSLLIDWRRMISRQDRRDGNCTMSRVKNIYVIQHPTSMKISAWMYSFVGLIMFTTSLLRRDYFPFSSYSLYNWHPTEPGFNQPYTAEEARQAAHRCVTEPPLNPTCLNLGGKRHHDMFPNAIDNYLSLVAIISDYSISESGLSGTKNKDCPLEIYWDWKPHSCWTLDAINMTSPLDAQLATLIQSIFTQKRRSKVWPMELRGRLIQSVRKGLRWRTIDAAGAALAEGPRCLVHNSKTTMPREPSPYNPASRFLRQIRTHMGSKYFGKGKKILAAGLIFAYLKKDGVGRQRWQRCLLGSSNEGEIKYGTFGNHEIGATVSAGTVNIPRPDMRAWMDIIKGIGIVIVMAISTYIWTIFDDLKGANVFRAVPWCPKVPKIAEKLA